MGVTLAPFDTEVSACKCCPQHPAYNPTSSSSSIGTTAHCGLWPVEKCPSIFSYLPPTLSIFSLTALEDLFLLPLLLLLLLLPLALQPTVGFGLSNNVLPFSPICHQLSPASHSQHLKISFYFHFPSFPESSPSSRPFQFLSEDLFWRILSFPYIRQQIIARITKRTQTNS